MKRIISLFLSMLMILSLAPTALAAEVEDTLISFALTVEGEHVVYVSTGTELTIELSLVNKTDGSSFNVESIWDEIKVDNNFFDIDETSIESNVIGNHSFQTDRKKNKWAMFNGYHLTERAYTSGEVVGTFKITVKATEGQTTLSNTSMSLYAADLKSYQRVSEDLTVIIGTEPPVLYTVNYMSEGSVVGTSQNAAGNITVGSAPANGPENYQFAGWENGGTVYQPGDSFELTGDTTFTAKWERIIPSYTLTFVTNGGSDIATVKDHEGTAVDLSGYTTEKSGYTFEGWYLDSELTNKVTSVTLDENKTVYAKWKVIPKPEYTLTFNTNGGSSVASITKVEGTLIDLEAYSPTKTGYIFGGWYTDSGLTQKVSQVTLNENKTVYAKWTEASKPTFVLSFNTNGGTTIDPVTKEEGTSVSLATYSPKKSGYTFAGWYLDEQLTKKVTLVTLNANTTVYAKWTAVSTGGGGGGFSSTHTITLMNVDGTKLDTKEYKENTTVDLTKLVFTKEGFEFEGWYTDKELTNKVTSIKLTKDITLYANWVSESDAGNRPDILTGDHYAYIVGRDNGKIEPEENITRAEVATIFFRLLKEDVRRESMTTENDFEDVNEGDWFNKAVSTLAGLGIVYGRGEAQFDPNAYITRGEFAAIVARISKAKYDGEDLFEDVDGHWANNYINIAASLGWVVGYEGKFRPDDEITRAETMTLVNRVLNRVPETVEDLHEDMIRWKDNMDTEAWYYLAVQEATNSHDYVRKEDGIYEQWTELKANPDWTDYE